MNLYSATATHPATVKSRVFEGKRRAHIEVRQGGTLASTTTGEINNMSEAEYAAACGFVPNESRIDRETKEAANTAGWFAESFLMSDVTNPAATLVLAAGVSGSVNLAPGPARRRMSTVSSAGAGVLSIDCEI